MTSSSRALFQSKPATIISAEVVDPTIEPDVTSSTPLATSSTPAKAGLRDSTETFFGSGPESELSKIQSALSERKRQLEDSNSPELTNKKQQLIPESQRIDEFSSGASGDGLLYSSDQRPGHAINENSDTNKNEKERHDEHVIPGSIPESSS